MNNKNLGAKSGEVVIKEFINTDIIKRNIKKKLDKMSRDPKNIIIGALVITVLLLSNISTTSGHNPKDNEIEYLGKKYELHTLQSRCYLDQKKKAMAGQVLDVHYCENEENYKKYSKFYKEAKNNKWDNTQALDFVVKGEGAFHSESYCDDYTTKKGKLIKKTADACTYWSIGYGSKSYRGEIIDKAEAKHRVSAYLRNMPTPPDCFSHNQKISIIDYQYQFGTYSQNIHKYVASCDKKSVAFILNPHYSNGKQKYLAGVHTRRIRGYAQWRGVELVKN